MDETSDSELGRDIVSGDFANSGVGNLGGSVWVWKEKCRQVTYT
jgi:hypothetical protein